MTDMPEVGRKADAHRIRNLYRRAFASASKNVARGRVIAVMQAAGIHTVLDLWGGGKSAEALVAAGFHVISVDDGSLDLEDSNGDKISQIRKQRALEYAGVEGDYEVRFGEAKDFAAEADAAFLDFCGPWSAGVRQTIQACQHMKVLVVTLMTDHDIHSKATDQRERLLAYLAWLKDAYQPKATNRVPGAGKTFHATPCRLLTQYKRPGGQPVLVFLLSQKRVPIEHLTHAERKTLNPEYAKRTHQRQAARQKERRHSDPAYRAEMRAYQNQWRAEHRDRVRELNSIAQRERRARLRVEVGR